MKCTRIAAPTATAIPFVERHLVCFKRDLWSARREVTNAVHRRSPPCRSQRQVVLSNDREMASNAHLKHDGILRWGITREPASDRQTVVELTLVS